MTLSRRLFVASAFPAVSFGKTSMARKMGLELYSLREEAKQNLEGTLALARQFGFRELEASQEYAPDAKRFRAMLDRHGLKITSVMAEYATLDQDVNSVAAYAHTLGATYVVCSTIPHRGKYLSDEDCKPAADKLNLWGERLSSAGLHCCYHTHGTEFKPSTEGTVFDVLAKQMQPRYANFEMDVFWIVYGGQDPVKMLQRYPGRFPLMHVKDIRKGTKLGLTPADVREEDSVPLGQGIVDLPAALHAGLRTGVKHFYIEDEATNAAEQLPLSLKYLKSII